MKIKNQKILLWLLLIVLVAIMSFGIFLIHPIKNYTPQLISVWGLVFLVFAIIGFYGHYVTREWWIERKIRKEKSLLNKYEEKTGKVASNFPISWPDMGFISPTEEVVFVFIAILAAMFSGIFIGIFLLGIELLILKILDMEQEKIAKPQFIVWVANGVVLLYISYFVAFFIVYRLLNIL